MAALGRKYLAGLNVTLFYAVLLVTSLRFAVLEVTRLCEGHDCILVLDQFQNNVNSVHSSTGFLGESHRYMVNSSQLRLSDK